MPSISYEYTIFQSQQTAVGDYMVNGRPARKHVEEEKNLAKDLFLNPYQMVESLVKEKLLKPQVVIRKNALQIVSGDHTVNGHLAQRHAEEERSLAKGMCQHPKTMEEKLAKVMLLKSNHVIRKAAQQTVNGDHTVNGRLAQKHAEEE